MENSLSIENGKVTLNGVPLADIIDFKMDTENCSIAKVRLTFYVPFRELNFSEHPITDKSAPQQ